MSIEHVPTSKKYVAPLFWSSSPSFDLNDLLTLGPSIFKCSNKLMSNPRSLTNSKKWSTRSSDVQLPRKKEPQYNVTIFRNFFEKKLMYPSYYFFIWEFVDSSNLKEYGVFCISVISSSLTKGPNWPNWRAYLDFVSSCQYFAAICESGNIFLNLSLSPFAEENEWFLSTMFRACKISAFKIWSFAVGLKHPVKEPALVLNVRCDLFSFSLLTWITVLECWFTSEIPPFLMLNDFKQRVHLAECIQFLPLLIHAYFSLQLALTFVSLLLISINYIVKGMESPVKKLKRTV